MGFDERFQQSLKIAQEIARGERSVPPLFIGYLPDGSSQAWSVPEGMSLDEATKPVIYEAISHDMQRLGVVSYLLMHEAWMLATSDMHERPSESDRREEVIVVMASDGENRRMQLFTFARDRKGRIARLTPRPLPENVEFGGDLMALLTYAEPEPAPGRRAFLETLAARARIENDPRLRRSLRRGARHAH